MDDGPLGIADGALGEDLEQLQLRQLIVAHRLLGGSGDQDMRVGDPALALLDLALGEPLQFLAGSGLKPSAISPSSVAVWQMPWAAASISIIRMWHSKSRSL